jgi:hypothetical protein
MVAMVVVVATVVVVVGLAAVVVVVATVVAVAVMVSVAAVGPAVAAEAAWMTALPNSSSNNSRDRGCGYLQRQPVQHLGLRRWLSK